MDNATNVKDKYNQLDRAQAEYERALASANDKAERLRQAEHEAAGALLSGTTPKGLDRREQSLEAERQRVRIAADAVERAKDELAQAKSYARKKKAQWFKAEQTRLVRELDSKLNEAAKANQKLQNLYQQAQDELGPQSPVDFRHWPELITGGESKLTRWRRAVAHILKLEDA